jgi:hypothetical protein
MIALAKVHDGPVLKRDQHEVINAKPTWNNRRSILCTPRFKTANTVAFSGPRVVWLVC